MSRPAQTQGRGPVNSLPSWKPGDPHAHLASYPWTSPLTRQLHLDIATYPGTGHSLSPHSAPSCPLPISTHLLHSEPKTVTYRRTKIEQPLIRRRRPHPRRPSLATSVTCTLGRSSSSFIDTATAYSESTLAASSSAFNRLPVGTSHARHARSGHARRLGFSRRNANAYCTSVGALSRSASSSGGARRCACDALSLSSNSMLSPISISGSRVSAGSCH